MTYVCQECGSSHSKWRGQCEGCAQWNTLSLEQAPDKKKVSQASASFSFHNLATIAEDEDLFLRLHTGFPEFDRVCGGGLVGGSVSLLAGDPGIGKSTLLLQIAGKVSEKIPTFYISGEESLTQIRLRAKRLGVESSMLHLASTTLLEEFLPSLFDLPQKTSPRGFIVLDSIQTISSENAQGPAGSLNQIRACLQHLLFLAKSQNIPIIIVGHITKDGMIAGPKVLEHMVDSVFYFEGEKSRPYRILRSVKNRFGATDEIGVFDMTQEGLQEISDPSKLFLSHRNPHIPGSCIYAGMEGSRPMLLEIQALSTSSFLAHPRRAVVGWDSNRLSMVLAILEARCHIPFSNKDVFLSVLSGIRITEPAADVAAAAALLSCIKKSPMPENAIAFGEMGLTGEIRPVPYTDLRLKEAEKMGFTKAFIPMHDKKQEKSFQNKNISIHPLNHITDLERFFSS